MNNAIYNRDDPEIYHITGLEKDSIQVVSFEGGIQKTYK